MPCRDYYDDHPSEYYAATLNGLKAQTAFAESALCQALAALERAHTDPLSLIDYDAAGITKADLANWWEKHKILDAKHKQIADEAARQAAIEKLSAAERRLLGL